MDAGRSGGQANVARRRARRSAVVLARRGYRHGAFVPADHGARGRALTPEGLRELEADCAAGRPIVLRGVLRLQSAGVRAAIEDSRRWFERLRHGASFADFAHARLSRRGGAAPRARITGASEDVADPLELEKLHAALAGGAGRAGQDLYAKLSWIADDERDTSLRIRFSFGSERGLDWRRDARSARAADRLAELVFPECAVLAGHAGLAALLARLTGAPVRFSERIVYNNAPGGGASFHHDAEPGQLGVLYGQLHGRTAWLALPRAELAEEVARLCARGPLARRAGTPRRAFLALEDPRSPALERLLNRDARLTRALVRRGALLVLARGDALILPSPSRDVCAWHAVFALGRRPSLAHSYGIFAADARGAASQARRTGGAVRTPAPSPSAASTSKLSRSMSGDTDSPPTSPRKNSR